MNRTRKLRARKAIVAAAALSSVVAGGAAGMLAFGGSANAANGDTTVSAPAASSSDGSTVSSDAAAPADDSARPARAEETPLTGDDLTKATEAALAANPGATVDRAETDGDGGAAYEVHITQADGTQATVKLDDSFAVTATETGGPGGGMGHGGRGRGDGGEQAGPHQAGDVTETPLTGDDLTKATEAAAAAAPGSTVVRAETDADGDSYEVHVTQADGTQATVKLDENFAVVTTETGGPGGGMGHGGQAPADGQQGGRGGRGPRGGQAPADETAPADDSSATTTA